MALMVFKSDYADIIIEKKFLYSSSIIDLFYINTEIAMISELFLQFSNHVKCT